MDTFFTFDAFSERALIAFLVSPVAGVEKKTNCFQKEFREKFSQNRWSVHAKDNVDGFLPSE